MRRFLFAALAALFLAGCATHPAMNRSEAVAAKTRTYSGATQAEVIAAAERLLKLADGDDFKVAQRAGGFVANRPWQYIGIGWSVANDVWIFKTDKRHEGVSASVDIGRLITNKWTESRIRLAEPDAVGLPPAYSPIDGTALYDLFWSRVDYLLGLRETWPTCAQANAQISSAETWGRIWALCDALMFEDRTPDGPMLSRTAARTETR